LFSSAALAVRVASRKSPQTRTTTDRHPRRAFAGELLNFLRKYLSRHALNQKVGTEVVPELYQVLAGVASHVRDSPILVAGKCCSTRFAELSKGP
jgi:hypothetical protein